MAQLSRVQDPQLLETLNRGDPENLFSPVTDPAMLRQLESTGPDVSPLIPPVQEQPTIPEELGGALVLDLPNPVSQISLTAAKAGVEFDSPSPSGHFLASLAFNKDERVKAYSLSASQSFGVDIKTRIGKETGQIEYLNPETNRWALALPPGTDTEALESLGGLGIILGPELVGGVVAAMSGVGTFATIGASAGGAFIGEMARLSFGKRLGINQDMTFEDALLSATGEAGISAAGGVVGVGLANTGRFIFDAIQGRIITREVAAGVGLSVEKADALATKINAVLGEKKMKFSLAQATNDENLLVLQSFLERSPEFRREFGAFADEQQAALKAFRAQIGRPYNTRVPIEQTEEAVKGIAQSAIEREVVPLNIFVQKAEAELDDMISSLRTRPFDDLGRTVRPFGDIQQAEFQKAAKEAADSLDVLSGRTAFIPNKRTVEAVSKLQAENQRLLLPSLERASEKLLAGGEKIFDPNARFTFGEAWDTISALKALERIAGKGLSSDEPALGQIKLIRSSLEKDLREATQGTALREEYDQFINWYRAEKTRLDRGAVGKMMQQSEGRFVVSDERVFRSVFAQGDPRPSKEFKALIENSPEQMTAMRESILDLYKKEVAPDGRVNLRAHNQFLKQYERSMGEFFTKSEIGALKKTRNAELVLQAREGARKRALDRINKSFEQELSSLKPGKLLSIAMDRNNPENARRMMKMLESTPDVRRAVKAEVRKEIAERTAGLTIDGERIFSAPKLNDFLNGKGGEKGFSQVLKAVMGDSYVDNLNVLNEAVQVASRETKFPNRSNTAFWINTMKNLTRAYVGLFTRPGRFLTAADRLRGRAANRVLTRAMLNPDNLEELMRVRGLDLRTKKAAAVIGAMGGSALLEDFDQ